MHPSRLNLVDEGRLIVSTLRTRVVRPWDGRTAITEMRDEGSTNWRQMEWIGWYLEHLSRRELFPVIGGGIGPTYANTTFDYQRDHVWDFKVHPLGTSALIVNDVAAIRACLSQRGTFGVVIIEGEATYDDVTGTFKTWHDLLKGGRSAYEVARVARGAPSRRRKVAFRPTDAYAVAFDGLGDLDRALAAGWAKDTFQKGMRNSDGSPRAAKITLDPGRVPRQRLIR